MADPLEIQQLLQGGWKAFTFSPFREGVEICTLYEGDSVLALLRYAPGACVPRHRHTGLEMIFILQGSQSDERGTYTEGSCVLNPPDYEHSVWSEEGCVVLIHWDHPVEFI